MNFFGDLEAKQRRTLVSKDIIVMIFSLITFRLTKFKFLNMKNSKETYVWCCDFNTMEMKVF